MEETEIGSREIKRNGNAKVSDTLSGALRGARGKRPFDISSFINYVKLL